MSRLSNFLRPLSIFLLITIFFFWPIFLKGYIPFPGDLLVGHYEPYKSNSYFGWGPGGVPHKAQGPDVIRELYPWKFFAIETMKKGQLPFWDPHNFSGNPQLANFQTAAFYPLNFIFFSLPFNQAWTIFIFLQPLLAGFFTYLFSKELGFKKIAAVFSGVVFAFSSYFTVWIEYGNIGHAILWLPLALYLVEKMIKNYRWAWVFLLIISLSLSILAGYIQGTIYLFTTVFFYYFYRFFQAKDRKIHQLAVFFLALVIPLLLSSPQLLSTLELFRLSARGAYLKEEFPRLLTPLYYTITTFVPDFFGHPATRNYWFWGTYIERVSYIGVIPLFLAILAFFGKRERPFWFFVFLASIAYFLSLNILPTRLILGLNPPIIATTVPTRILSVFCFSGAILSGMGLNFFLVEKSSRAVKRVAILFVFIYIFIWFFLFLAPKFFSQAGWITHINVAKRNLILPTFFAFAGVSVIFIAEFLKEKKNLLVLFLLFLTITDLFYFFHKITPFSPKEFVYPQTPIMSFLKGNAGIDRFWGYGVASIETNFATYEQVFSTDGSDALHLKRYGELVSSSKDGKIAFPVPRRDANIFPGFGNDDLKNNIYRQRIIDLLGVKYILNKNESLDKTWQPDYQTFPEEIYTLVWQQGKWQAYENKKVLPRIFLTTNYLVENDKEKIINKIFERDFDLKTVILEEELPAIIKPTEAGDLIIKNYTPNRIDVKVNISNAQLLFLSDNYYPGWRAFIDREETKIYRADYTFRVVLVPAGEHEIVFQYEPTYLLWK